MLETSKKRCLTVGRRSRDFNHCRVTVQRLFSKFSQIAWNVQKTLFDSRPTVAWPPTTVAWPISDFIKNFLIAWSVEKSLFDSRPTVAWPPTTVAWPFSDFFNKVPNGLKRRENVDWQSADGRLTSDNSCVTFQRLSFHISLKSLKICLKASEESLDRPAILFPWFLRTTSANASQHVSLSLCRANSPAYMNLLE